MESQSHSADRISQSYEGDISIRSATLSQPVTNNEGEEVYDDEGYTDYEYESDDANEVKYDDEQKSKLGVDDIPKPHVGMVFNSVEHAYQFYKKYGREMGFGIRRGSSRRSRRDNVLIWRELLCNKEGWRRKNNKIDDGAKKKHRGETRTGCRAKLVVKLQTKNGTWVVTVFEDKHNHKFEALKKHQVLRTHRNLCKAGVLTDFTMSYLSEETGGSRNVGIVDRGTLNHMHTERKMDLRKGDLQAVLDYFNEMQAANPNFLYAIKLDPNGQLASLFWVDATSRMDVNYFGDVVCFDASYGTDRYKIPFVPIFGVNHHLQITYFGGALILNETKASYVWVLETWMKATRRSHPKTILTDQDSAMSEAISQVFPHTSYRYCLWDIFQNAQKHLEHLYKQNCSFGKDFSSCIYNTETPEEFEVGWQTLLTTYNLLGNEWMARLYSKRREWVPIYFKDIFCAHMTTKQCSESINKFFKDFLTSDMLLKDFVRAIDKALVHRREKELRTDHNENYVRPCLRVSMHIEEEAGNLYTKSVFEKFQDELLISLRYMSTKVEDDEITSTYRCWLQNRGHIVKLCLDDSSAKCSCQNFEHTGILCRHILKVYSVTNVIKIPSKYVLKRWTREAKCGFAVKEGGQMQEGGDESSSSFRHSSLCHQGMTIAAKGASSIEVYKVAKHGLGKTLDEVENALSRISLESMGSNKDDAAKTPICEITENRSVQCQSLPEMELDPHTEKKRKYSEMPTSSDKRESRSPQNQEDEGAKEGSSVNTVIVEAPKEQTLSNEAVSSRSLRGFGTCSDVTKFDIHPFGQETSVITSQLLDSSFYLQRHGGSASTIGHNQLSEGKTPTTLALQLHDNTNIELRHPSQEHTPSNILDLQQPHES